ncbi:MAG: hypothetical protein J6U67_08260 [Lachnospiraceae bacterium]|nr:hypothetical protein [Lachnospiraceae bacterium]
MAKKTFTFDAVPANVEELKAIPEASLTDNYATVALTMLVLLNYENSVDETHKMLDYLKGPEPLSVYEKQFLKDRLNGKAYVVRSFFEGTSPSNDYTPSKPYKIEVFDNPYSFQDQGYAQLYMQSSGADSPRFIKVRLKPSEGKWYMVENFALSDIRIPVSQDKWA